MDKILGCLIGAAYGDAMGAATEMRSRKQIEEKFSGYVKEFFLPPDDTFARGNKRGQVTDDFSLAYDTCEIILKNNGKINEKVARDALMYWAREDNYYFRFAGPTTRHSIDKMKGLVDDKNIEGFVPVNDNSKATNGSAMKIAPIALFSNGNIDQAINDAICISSVSHPNVISISAASAVAAATSAAMKEKRSIKNILEAGIYGAREGRIRSENKYANLAGASVEKRIDLAIKLAINSNNFIEALDNIADYIGSGLMAQEAVPAVFGIIAASKGDTIKAIHGGVNIGYDTDTVATMIGGIMGTLNGMEVFDENDIELLNNANNFDLRVTASKIKELIK